MKTWEMIEELSKNPDKKFKNQRGEEIRLLPDNDLYFGGENGYNFISITDEWEEVKKPVTFAEVLQIASEYHKRIMVEHEIFTSKYGYLSDILNDLVEEVGYDLGSAKIARILLEGKFYIED